MVIIFIVVINSVFHFFKLDYGTTDCSNILNSDFKYLQPSEILHFTLGNVSPGTRQAAGPACLSSSNLLTSSECLTFTLRAIWFISVFLVVLSAPLDSFLQVKGARQRCLVPPDDG